MDIPRDERPHLANVFLLRAKHAPGRLVDCRMCALVAAEPTLHTMIADVSLSV